MDEDGDKDGKTSGAVEKIAEGEVEKEDRDVVAQPRELFPVPGRSKCSYLENKFMLPYPHVGNGNQSQKISKNADNDYEGAVDGKTKSPVCDFLRLTITVVSPFATLWIPNALSVTLASDLLHHCRRHRD